MLGVWLEGCICVFVCVGGQTGTKGPTQAVQLGPFHLPMTVFVCARMKLSVSVLVCGQLPSTF